MISIDIEHAFDGDVKKNRIQTTEVLLHTAIGNLAKYKKFQDWTSMKTVFLPTFFMEAVVTDRETAAEALLKKFTENIKVHGEEDTPEESDEREDIGSNEDDDKDKAKTRSSKYATTRDTTD